MNIFGKKLVILRFSGGKPDIAVTEPACAVSSFSAAIATGLVALIGYRHTMPQPTDPSTPAIFWMTISMYFGLPLIGWVCTLCAMRKTPLSKEKMEEVQKSIQEKKQAEVEKVIEEMK